jgi:hypothetical protein
VGVGEHWALGPLFDEQGPGNLECVWPCSDKRQACRQACMPRNGGESLHTLVSLGTVVSAAHTTATGPF